MNSVSFYEKYIKRLLDFILSLVAIIVLAPVFLLVAILVRKKLGKPVIFSQERPGLHEKIFKLYKFRSMTDERNEKGDLLPDELRLTSFGKFLRSTSLDELPELFNILKGEMSFVGPRPLLVRYLGFYTDEERHRHDVRPGLTGYAQINGRNYVAWNEKFKMDLQYIHELSLITDIKIILFTIFVVFKRDNIETASQIIHNGVVYKPLDVERSQKRI